MEGRQMVMPFMVERPRYRHDGQVGDCASPWTHVICNTPELRELRRQAIELSRSGFEDLPPVPCI